MLTGISPGKQHFPKEYISQGRDLDKKQPSVVVCSPCSGMSFQLLEIRLMGDIQRNLTEEQAWCVKDQLLLLHELETLFLGVSLVSTKAQGL